MEEELHTSTRWGRLLLWLDEELSWVYLWKRVMVGGSETKRTLTIFWGLNPLYYVENLTWYRLYHKLFDEQIVYYSSNLLTPTWPLCKNILSVDYERSISFRKCNRWKSFKIVHVCLNNKNVIISNAIIRLDGKGLVEGWASIASDPKIAGSSLNFCKLLVLIISFFFVFGVNFFSSAVLFNKMKL